MIIVKQNITIITITIFALKTVYKCIDLSIFVPRLVITSAIIMIFHDCCSSHLLFVVKTTQYWLLLKKITTNRQNYVAICNCLS